MNILTLIVATAAAPAAINLAMFRMASGRIDAKAVVFPLIWLLIATGIHTSRLEMSPIMLGVLWSSAMGIILGLSSMIDGQPAKRMVQIVVFQVVGGLLIGCIAYLLVSVL